ncbi:MAG TPA: right-handed parallel beta-helix repeat-containing protein, partial [Bryobacterales bacterium]|nr:right-handed parallel beta-helix repeat-containing protein [Bryobacterales bacterium]
MTRPFLRPGDTIFVRGGVYRPASEAVPSPGSVTDDALIRPVASGEPSRPITVMAQPNETVVLSGRFPAAAWQALDASATIYYYDYSTPAVFPFDHPFQVVQDGRLLYRVSTLDSLDRPGRCFVDTTLQRIYAWITDGAPPASHLMEYGASITGIEFQSGVHGWRLSGLSLAGFRTAGIVIRDGAGSIELDHLDISYAGAHRPGADPTSGYALAVYDTAGGNHVHDCNLHHTEAEALHISQSGSGGGLFENNDIHDAGGPDWFQQAYNGEFPIGPGVILRGSRVTVRGNHIHSNGYHGLILESDLRGS